MKRIQRRKSQNRGFTLIEMIIVIFIILILALVLIIAIQIAISKSKTGDTIRLSNAVKASMQKYQEEYGVGQLPGADVEPSKEASDFLAGNQALLKGIEKYMEEGDKRDFIAYWDNSAKIVTETGADSDRILVDGHRRPIVYWEWISARQRSSVSADPTAKGSQFSTSRKVPSWAGPGEYEIWSSGGDGEFGNADDIDQNGAQVTSPLSGAFE